MRTFRLSETARRLTLLAATLSGWPIRSHREPHLSFTPRRFQCLRRPRRPRYRAQRADGLLRNPDKQAYIDSFRQAGASLKRSAFASDGVKCYAPSLAMRDCAPVEPAISMRSGNALHASTSS
jgi:hypothetical protein